MENEFITNYLKSQGREPRSSASRTSAAPQTKGPVPVTANDPFMKGIQEARQAGYSDEEINQHLQKQGKISPTLNPVWKPEDTPSIGNLTGSTALGRRLGGMAFGRTQAAGKISQAQQESQRLMQELDARINNNKAMGRDTSRLEEAKQQLMQDMNMTQYTVDQLRSGGVSNRQVVGSALQTAAFSFPATRLAGKALGGTKVGKALTTLERTAGMNPAKFGAVEGALSGLPFGFGAGLQEGKSVDEAAQTALGYSVAGAAGGAILGPIINKAIKYVGPKIQGVVGAMPSGQAGKTAQNLTARDGTKATELQKRFMKRFNEGLGFSPSVSNREIMKYSDPSKIAELPRFRGIETIFNTAPDTMVLNKAGEVVPFNPLKTKGREFVSEFLQAQGANKVAISNRVSDSLSQMASRDPNNTGFMELQGNVTKRINELINPDKYGAEARNYFMKQLPEISQKQTVQGILDEVTRGGVAIDAQKFFADTAQQAKIRDAAPKIKQIVLEEVGNYMKKGGVDFDDMWKQYRGLLSFEDELNAMFRKNLKGPQVDMIDSYGLSNILAGAAYGNPTQIAKGAAFDVVKIAKQLSKKTDIGNIQKAFQDFDEWYKLMGYTPGVEKAATSAVQPQLQAPQAGTPRVKMESGAPIRMPAGANNQVDIIGQINALPPQQKQQAIEAIQTLSQQLGGEEGFSKIAGMLGIAGATGVGALTQMTNTQTFENVPRETAQPTQALDVNRMKEEIAFRETRGEANPYSAINKNTDGTTDYGKYQVNKQTLDHWSKRALGRKYTPQEFMADPDAQEKFFEYVMDRFATEYEVTDPEVAMALWHKGWGPGNINKSREELIKEAQDYINTR